MTPDYIEHYGSVIQKHTDATHVSMSVLKHELADISRIGYAINRGEWRIGIGGIAAPVIQQIAHQFSAHMGYSGGYFGLA